MSTSRPMPEARIRSAEPWRLRPPDPGDGAAVHALVSLTPPLDPNSVYAYLLQALHFAGTCALAERDGRLLGYVAGYCPPGRPDTLFIWQVAVDPAARGQGLGHALLRHLLARPALRELRWLEATVSPDNLASTRLFHGLAHALDCACTVSPLFSAEAFGALPHAAEPLFRIGPFATSALPLKEEPHGHVDLRAP
ncbi:MAG: diaminobutyrate acetyltransferase [Pseudomonadota bacterium]